MAIDSTLFATPVPAGTYAVGDRIPLAAIRGPQVVRDGYGPAILKKIFCCSDASATSGNFVVKVKNSNWIDGMSNIAIGPNDVLLDDRSGAIQRGQDCDLVPNSGWEVYAECVVGVTTTAATDLFCVIDVDYPRVAAVQNPRAVQGFPVTIEPAGISHTITAAGSSNAAVWTTVNVDVFKAGSKYLIVEASFRDGAQIGFMSISGAAGQAGLERIIPARSASMVGIKYTLDYSTPLVKGPMNLNFVSFGSAGSATPYVYLDFVKKSN